MAYTWAEEEERGLKLEVEEEEKQELVEACHLVGQVEVSLAQLELSESL